jgi:competence protein ComFC
MYEEIKDLLHTKHTDLGYFIYTIMAKNSFRLFAQEFTYLGTLASLSIDDVPKQLYSHTAILNKALQSKHIKPQWGKICANNSVQYSGKSKAFRLSNPRDFSLQEFHYDACILVDDIITTGTTLTEAITTCKTHNKEVVFCLTLADARNL